MPHVQPFQAVEVREPVPDGAPEWVSAAVALTRPYEEVVATNGKPPGCWRLSEWAGDALAYDLGHTTRRILFQSTSNANVVLTGIEPVIMENIDLPALQHIGLCAASGGADVPDTCFEIDLDRFVATSDWHRQDTEPAPTCETKPTFQLRPNEAQYVTWRSTAADRDYRWRLEVTLVVDGRTMVLTFPERGVYRTVGVRNAPSSVGPTDVEVHDLREFVRYAR